MSETGFTFDWQRRSDNDFLKWMIPTMLAGVDAETLDRLSAVSGKWTQVELRIQINGIEVPAEQFVDAIERNMTHLATKEAERLVASIPRLDSLREVMDEADRALKQELRDILAQAGVELSAEDEW